MELRRTANAGFLLTLDDVTIAMDGVCLVVSPYQATPPAELGRFLAAPPDLLSYTHDHADHFDPDFARRFQGMILGTEQIAQALPGGKVTMEPVTIGNVKVTPVPTRHIGKSGVTTSHQSLVIEGSKRVFFMGDATPAQLSSLLRFGKPDVLIAPFAYAATASAVRVVNEASPQTLILTHLPQRENDPAQLWPAVEAMLPGFAMPVLIPSMGETVSLR